MLYVNDNIKKILGVDMFNYCIVSMFRPILKLYIILKQKILDRMQDIILFGN